MYMPMMHLHNLGCLFTRAGNITNMRLWQMTRWSPDTTKPRAKHDAEIPGAYATFIKPEAELGELTKEYAISSRS